ncbi:unnamed protein product, partial [Prorocentrum cordatum]
TRTPNATGPICVPCRSPSRWNAAVTAAAMYSTPELTREERGEEEDENEEKEKTNIGGAARSLWYSGCAHPSGGRGGLAAAAVACPPRWPPPESKQASTSRRPQTSRDDLLPCGASTSGPAPASCGRPEERPRSSPAAPADPRGCGRRARRAGPHGGNLLPEAGSGGPGAEGQPRPRPPRGAAGTAN